MAHNAWGPGHVDRGGRSSVLPVAQLVRNYPAEFSVQGDADDYDKLLKVANETRLPGGSLLASVELDRQAPQGRGRPRSATPWSPRRAGVPRRRRTTTSVSRSPRTVWPTSLRFRPVVVASGTTPAWSSTRSSVPGQPASSTSLRPRSPPAPPRPAWRSRARPSWTPAWASPACA